MAVKSVRSRIRDSLLSQLMSKLEVTEKRDLPKELDLSLIHISEPTRRS